MKKLKFDELLLVSTLHKRARKIVFDPVRTVIQGENETGKSAVLKCLYACFGAAPPVTERAWLNAEVTCLLRFTVDGVRYSILWDGESYTLFNPEERVIGTFRSVRDGFARQLADLFDFKLRFYSKTGDSLSAHPAYLFAPFYIDQDRGWSNPWASFVRLRSSRRLDTLEYHLGIRPNSYFDAKSRVQELQEDLRMPKQELDTLQRVLNDLNARVSQSSVDINPQAFAGEVDRLVAACNDLKAHEEQYRDRIMSMENDRISLESQRRLVLKAAEELRKDYKFAMSREPPQIECPTCGAQYENSIVEKFLLAQDEDRCVSFISELDAALANVTTEISQVRNAFSSVSSQLERVNNALDARRDQLTLREVIQAEGKRELRDKILSDISELDGAVRGIRDQIRTAKGEMRAATNPELRRQIRDQYSVALQDIAVRLAVAPIPSEMTGTIAPKILASGSDLPRRLLAFYVAILRTIYRNTSGTFCPFVVDAVNQQDQGGENLTKMFELLASGLPDDTQLILSCVDTKGVRFEGKIVELSDKRGVLRAGEYEEVVAVVRPLIDARFVAERENKSNAEN